MKFMLCQTNPTPGLFSANFEQIVKGIDLAAKEAADVAVFPESCIPGYLSRDLVYDQQFIDANLGVLQQVVVKSKEVCWLTILVGYFDHNRTGFGKPFRNLTAVIRNGCIIATYQKQLLPFYDVFDEGRYFEPGKELCVIEIGGVKWGICTCEDLWNDKGQDDYNYENNPVDRYRKIGVQRIISTNASPFVAEKLQAKQRMFESITANGGIIVYVNQKGAQDELIFDGHSMVVANGEVVAQLPTSSISEPDYKLVEIDLDGKHGVVWGRGNKLSKYQMLRSMLVLGLRDYVHKTGFSDVVLGSSGGIDSAVVIALACEALGPEHVHAIRMPGPYSSKGSLDDALELHENLGCWDYLIPIDIKADVENFENNIKGTRPGITFSPKQNLAYQCRNNIDGRSVNPVGKENLQARKRGEIVMRFSNQYGALALTTGNKTELATGYCTLYGDMNGGFAPINDVLKMEVYGLARHFNATKVVIPGQIIVKAPSAELAPDQTDEKSLLPYPVLDRIVDGYITNFVGDIKLLIPHLDSQARRVQPEDPDALEMLGWIQQAKKWAVSNGSEADYLRIIRMIDRNEFKRRQAAPGLKVSRIAFGTGRRLPIAKGQRVGSQFPK